MFEINVNRKCRLQLRDL